MAKLLEKNSMRIQKSIFFYPNVSREMLKNLIIKVEDIIDSKHDDVRIYEIDIEHSLTLKSAVELTSALTFAGVTF
jgi:CRISPR-associated endonuclease Cas2